MRSLSRSHIPSWPGGRVTEGGLICVETMGSKQVYDGAWLTVREDEVRRPDGSVGTHTVVDGADIALVIPVDGDRHHRREDDGGCALLMLSGRAGGPGRCARTGVGGGDPSWLTAVVVPGRVSRCGGE